MVDDLNSSACFKHLLVYFSVTGRGREWRSSIFRQLLVSYSLKEFHSQLYRAFSHDVINLAGNLGLVFTIDESTSTGIYKRKDNCTA